MNRRYCTWGLEKNTWGEPVHVVRETYSTDREARDNVDGKATLGWGYGFIGYDGYFMLERSYLSQPMRAS